MTQFVLAAVLGALFALGTFLLLRRDVVRVVWGVVIISQAANVYLVTMGGLSGVAPIVPGHGEGVAATAVTDPLVQALVLTAIVISLGTTAFVLVLTYRVYEEHGTIDLLDLGIDRGGPGDVDESAGGAGPLSADGGRADEVGRNEGKSADGRRDGEANADD
jgi:multicomponent Na+:H+ antiporter subunit C